jgi:hypothetical protein
MTKRKPRRSTAPFTLEYLKSRLHYDPDTGAWTWLWVRRRSTMIGQKAGYAGIYNMIGIDRVDYPASNLAWFYMTGEWPATEVDHKNRNKLDDRWDNLRLATHSLNGTNWTYPNKKSGLPRGVVKSRGLYQAYISINGKGKFLGRFKTPEEAHEAYLRASEFRKEFLPIGN